MKSIHNKIALVTGAASGMGRATAKEMARQGAHLILVDINEEGLKEVAADIERMENRAHIIVANLALKEDIARVAKTALEQEDHIDILYNNAGVALLEEIKDTTTEDWEWLVDINMWAPIRLTQALLPHMIERGTGHIVTTASVAGLMGAPMLGAYSVTKFGMVGYSEALRAEVAQYGISVSAVCPGVVRTKLVETIKTPGVKDGMSQQMDRYPSWVGLDEREAGKQIVKGIRKNKGYILIAREAKPLWYLKRISPEATYFVNKLVFKLIRSERDKIKSQQGSLQRSLQGSLGTVDQLPVGKKAKTKTKTA